MQNPFVWHDLMTTDVAGAQSFYGKVVGWTFNVQRPDYHVLQTEKGDMGGIMAQPEQLKGMPPFWAGYVFTPDVDAAAARAKALGGTVHREPFDIPGVLRMAVIADPTGPVLNIMQPLMGGDGNMPPAGTPGAVGWNELHAGDLAKAWDFYAAMFGWTKGTTMPMGEMGDYQMFQINGKDAGGMMKRHAMMPVATWLYYFNVDGIDAAVERITTNGGKIAMGPHQVPGGNWIVSAFDPQGGNFNLLSATK
jgi:uncharacterized protein